MRRYALPQLSSGRVAESSLTWEQQAHDEVLRTAARVLKGNHRIVVGPWMSELGFEILYWIPFLRWLVEEFAVDPDRLVAVSRGGVADWYDGICGSYVEIFDHIEVDEFRELVTTRWSEEGGQKQTRFGPWDERVLQAAAPELTWEGEPVVHPALMYRLFRRFWRDTMTLGHVFRHTRHEPFLAPTPVGDFVPPAEYVAVKFYFSEAFPDTDQHRRLVGETVATLAEHTDVVLLHTGLELDDHVECAAAAAAAARIHRIAPSIKPASNLTLQSYLISRATSFVGTYGGFSYLAPAYGVPSFSLANSRTYLASHLELARRVAWSYGSSFTLADASQLDRIAVLEPETA